MFKPHISVVTSRSLLPQLSITLTGGKLSHVTHKKFEQPLIHLELIALKVIDTL